MFDSIFAYCTKCKFKSLGIAPQEKEEIYIEKEQDNGVVKVCSILCYLHHKTC